MNAARRHHNRRGPVDEKGESGLEHSILFLAHITFTELPDDVSLLAPCPSIALLSSVQRSRGYED